MNEAQQVKKTDNLSGFTYGLGKLSIQKCRTGTWKLDNDGLYFGIVVADNAEVSALSALGSTVTFEHDGRIVLILRAKTIERLADEAKLEEKEESAI